MERRECRWEDVARRIVGQAETHRGGEREGIEEILSMEDIQENLENTLTGQ